MNNLKTVKGSDGTEAEIWFDYDNQAWIKNGRYVRCGHPEQLDCGCYGRTHEGEIAPTLKEAIARAEQT